MMVLFATAHAVLLLSGTIVYDMQQMMLHKQLQRTKDAASVHVWHPLFHIVKCKRLRLSAYLLPHQHPHRRRLDSMIFQI